MGNQQYRNMNGEQLATEARQVWQQANQHIESKAQQQELQQVVSELTGRIEFVTTGKQPQPTPFSGLDATALAQHTRTVVSRIGRELPIEQREQLDIVQALSDRIEVAGSGSPGAAHQYMSGSSGFSSR